MKKEQVATTVKAFQDALNKEGIVCAKWTKNKTADTPADGYFTFEHQLGRKEFTAALKRVAKELEMTSDPNCKFPDSICNDGYYAYYIFSKPDAAGNKMLFAVARDDDEVFTA
jgi:hypothetical protein